MAIITCGVCNKRMITQKILVAHMAKSHSDTEVRTAPAIVETPVIPVVPEPVKTSITLRFKRDIEVGINGHWFRGKEIEVKDMATASEIVRIAKVAYGWDCLL
jgi:hypothetical protein